MSRLVALFSTTLLFALLSACSEAPNDDKGAPTTPTSLTIGFAQIGAESAWRTAETQSIRAEAEKRKVNLKFSDAQQKQENQVNAVRSFIVQRVDAIILAPVVETGWEPVLREAKAAGIPVVLVDRGVDVSDPELFTTLIASDFVEEGRLAGRWLAGKLEGKGRIVELRVAAQAHVEARAVLAVIEEAA